MAMGPGIGRCWRGRALGRISGYEGCDTCEVGRPRGPREGGREERRGRGLGGPGRGAGPRKRGESGVGLAGHAEGRSSGPRERATRPS
jgi:hypothetical protein